MASSQSKSPQNGTFNLFIEHGSLVQVSHNTDKRGTEFTKRQKLRIFISLKPGKVQFNKLSPKETVWALES